MVKLLIIADDFTGALDTGIQFKKYGICTQVFTKTRIEDNEINPDTEVLVIDSESRPLTKEEAYLGVLNITKWAISKGIEIIFKKTDSALRGNIGAELKAVADAAGEENLFFMPGYPEIHRITKNGMHYIDGELLENSVFGKDPFEPVKRSYIPDIINEQSCITVRCVQSGEKIPESRKEDSSIIVCDTVTTEDIDKRLEELQEKKCLKFIAGCAGLAARLVWKLPFEKKDGQMFRQTKALYVACGSLNKITEKQVEYAEKTGGFERIHLTMEQKLMPEYYQSRQGKEFTEWLVKLCETRKKLIVDTFDQDDKKEMFLEKHKIPKASVRFRISDSHGCIVDEILKSNIDVTILMTGGDTLMGYMKKIGCTQIEPLCEIEQGIVASNITCHDHTVQVISKSGGFGTEDVMCIIAEKVIRKES